MLTRLFVSTLILLCATQVHAAIPDVNDFRVVPQFPQPATGAFGVVGTATGDGRFILWDGDTVYFQTIADSHVLNPIATGYAGDPGFLALAPDGHTLLMGGGFNPVLYLLDLNAPADYAVGDEIPVPAHFSGAFLSSNLVVLDRSTDDFSASELIVLNIDDLMSPLTRSQVPFHSILEFPKNTAQIRDVIIEKPLASFSANVFVTPDRLQLYAMDANTRELRTFSVQGIIDAFENMTTLDWTADGIRIGLPGEFFTGGVIGQSIDDELIIDGSEGFGLPGGIMYIDPQDPAMILATLDPAGTEPFYTGIYNRATDEVIAIDSTFAQPLQAYARNSAIAPIPPRSPCPDFTTILEQWEAFSLQHNLDPETADINNDGIPDKAILLLMQNVSCQPVSEVNSATIVAYDLNLDAVDAEQQIDLITNFRELIAILMIVGVDMQTDLSLLQEQAQAALINEYTRVTCAAGLCQPVFQEKQIAALVVGLRAADEPYSATGDLDSDGTSNLDEYNNVIQKGGDANDFVIAAAAPELDGTSTLERHSEESACFIATAAYGTPLASEINTLRRYRDAHLLSNAAGSVFVDSYYRLSPYIADKVAEDTVLKRFVRTALTPVIFMIEHSAAVIAITIALALVCMSRRLRVHAIRSKNSSRRA